MKKNLHIILLCIGLSFTAYAQKVTKGKITYKVHIQPKGNLYDKIMNNPEYDEAMKERLLEIFNNNREVKAELEFTETESMYKVKDGSDYDAKKLNFSRTAAGGDDLFYTNFSKGTQFYNHEDKVANEWLLITYNNMKWKVTEETKTILGYLCYKAVEIDKEKKEKFISTVWFTKELPFSIGPKDYGGLPGIILEVKMSNRTFVAEKIDLNPKRINIVAPSIGRWMTRKEYKDKYKDFFKD